MFNYKTKLCLLSGLLISGCSALIPYPEEFMCEKTDNYGKCINVNEAYERALDGWTKESHISENGSIKKGHTSEDVKNNETSINSESLNVSYRNSYKESEYREMKKLIDQPITPIIKPPKVIRTLIVAYPGNRDSLYSPRYIWHIVDTGNFVIGDYLNQPEIDKGSLFTTFSGKTK